MENTNKAEANLSYLLTQNANPDSFLNDADDDTQQQCY